MRVGIDIDNTSIDYSLSFTRKAQDLTGVSLPRNMSKRDVQSFVVKTRGEELWTQIQGSVYSESPLKAEVSEGLREFLAIANIQQASVVFVSHKTRFPIVGPKVDLRKPVLDFMRLEKLIEPAPNNSKVVFCESPNEKLEVIRESNFDFFIDDLVSIIDKIPLSTQAVHYMCDCRHSPPLGHLAAIDWNSIGQHIFGQVESG